MRGWGFTYDIATGRNRPFYYDENGVRRYMDEQQAEPVSDADKLPEQKEPPK